LYHVSGELQTGIFLDPKQKTGVGKTKRVRVVGWEGVRRQAERARYTIINSQRKNQKKAFGWQCVFLVL
jgi:hypothetical protein